ncbi:unnamed protein product [Amoebophrya sp. A120]|nr:unnamed protein product [Amoebophrya sp. A120]|eukprot:GSA120T00020409001.1
MITIRMIKMLMRKQHSSSSACSSPFCPPGDIHSHAGARRSRQFFSSMAVLLIPTRFLFLWTVVLQQFSPAQLFANAQASVWCNSFWLTAYSPPPYQSYATCSDNAWQTADFTVPGTSERVHVDCWCQNDLTPKWRDMYSHDPSWTSAINCCDHPTWTNMCTLDCNPDCTDARAQECKQKCPPLCLETAYESLAGAPCECSQCWDKVKCLFDHAVAETASGNSMKVCDSVAFERTTMAAEWIACVSRYPHSTRWEQIQASAHCACKSDIITALNSTSCCTSPEYEHICTDENQLQCNALAAHCGSSEALSCGISCATKCNHIADISDDCNNHCIKKDSPCAKYQKCEPPATKNHDYICDDGVTQPNIGGCCKREDANFQTMDNLWCPRFCGNSRVYWLVATQRYECDCDACPNNAAGLDNNWHLALDQEIDHLYKTGLERIVERLQIPDTGPERSQLNAIYEEMSVEIKRAYPYAAAALPQNLPDAALDVAETYKDRMEDKGREIWNSFNPSIAAPSLEGVWTLSSADWQNNGSEATPSPSLNVVVGDTSGVNNLPGQEVPSAGSRVQPSSSSADDSSTDDNSNDMLSWMIGFAVMAGASLGICGLCILIERYSAKSREEARRRDAALQYQDGIGGMRPPVDTVVVGQPVLNSHGTAIDNVPTNIPTGLIIDNDKSRNSAEQDQFVGRGFAASGGGGQSQQFSSSTPGYNSNDSMPINGNLPTPNASMFQAPTSDTLPQASFAPRGPMTNDFVTSLTTTTTTTASWADAPPNQRDPYAPRRGRGQRGGGVQQQPPRVAWTGTE